MSGRKSQVNDSLPNPVVRYYDFKGTKNGFVWYNKDKGQEEIAFPLSFALVTVRNEVSGYHKKTKSGIWSNSISEYGVAKEELKVYSQKPDKANNTALAQGLWKSISEDCRKQGGHFTKVLIGYEFGVGIIKISLTGTGIAAYGDFVKTVSPKSDLYDKVIEVKDTRKNDEDDDYTIPVFSTGKALTKKQEEEVDQAYEQVKDYFASKNVSVVSNQEEDTGVSEEELSLEPQEVDDLPF